MSTQADSGMPETLHTEAGHGPVQAHSGNGSASTGGDHGHGARAVPGPRRSDDSASASVPVTQFLARSRTRHEDAVYRRHSSWKPGIWPVLLPFLVILFVVGWFAQAHAGLLGWPVTVLWTWPILSTVVGIYGAAVARRRLKISRRDWQDRHTMVTRSKLIVTVPTIGRKDTYPALERSVLSYCDFLPTCFADLRIDVITEEGCAAQDDIDFLASQSPLIRVVVVPKDYRTPNGTRFKARANHYSHELRIADGEDRDDVWVLHMDDDTGVGPDTAEAVARFIADQQYAPRGQEKHLGQGILTYPRENAVNKLTWYADAIRPGDDIARFAACTGGGTPISGLHGEMLLIRASIEATIGWDFGPKAIVEDAQLALKFCGMYPGKSAWFDGRCYGASPSTIRDFIKQRDRWSWGLCGLVTNRSIPLRHRAFLAYGMASWICGPLQHFAVLLLFGMMMGDTNTTPVTLWIIPLWALNLAYTVWMYWEGLRLNGSVSANGRRKWYEPVVVLALIPFFSLIEGWGGFRGFLRFICREENKFVVIAKPA